jgi:N-acetylglucosaminyldiphosphoundecaprenol N-acetyl-beta-D-mannosaminyltransferase
MRSTVQIGPFAVDDLSQREVVDAAVGLSVRPDRPPARAYALHVGGLNHRADSAFVAEMAAAELVYADGGSIVGLARLAGARVVERAPTTDIGWDVLRGFRAVAGRSARIALIGGPPGLAQRAGQALEAGGAGEVVFTADGFQQSWDETLSRLAGAKPDICVVGMGAPREMLWVKQWRDEIDSSLVLTCGGWFGFLAGEESRAPALLRRPGLEWMARVAQSPRRLGARYARGAWSTAVVATQTIKGKWFS